VIMSTCIDQGLVVEEDGQGEDARMGREDKSVLSPAGREFVVDQVTGVARVIVWKGQSTSSQDDRYRDS